MFLTDWVLALSFPPVLTIFVFGLLVGAVALLLLIFLLILIFLPSSSTSTPSNSNNIPSSPGLTSLSERTSAASSLISSIREPALQALEFSDRTCTFGFTIALELIKVRGGRSEGRLGRRAKAKLRLELELHLTYFSLASLATPLLVASLLAPIAVRVRCR